MVEDDFEDRIAEDPDDQVEDDEMSPGEAGLTRGAEEEKEEAEDEDEVR
jgi:hypothetical protein